MSDTRSDTCVNDLRSKMAIVHSSGSLERLARMDQEILNCLQHASGDREDEDILFMREQIFLVAGAISKVFNLRRKADFYSGVTTYMERHWDEVDSIQGEFLMHLGDTYHAMGWHEHATSTYERAKAEFSSSRFLQIRRQARNALRRAAYNAYDNGSPIEAARLTREAIALATKDPEPRTDELVGTTCNLFDFEPDSIKFYLSELALLVDSVEDPLVMSIYFNRLGTHFAHQGMHERACIVLKRGELALRNMDDRRYYRTVGVASNMHNQALALKQLDRIDEATECLQRSIKLNDSIRVHARKALGLEATARLISNLNAAKDLAITQEPFGSGRINALRHIVELTHNPFLEEHEKWNVYGDLAYAYWSIEELDSMYFYAVALDSVKKDEIRSLRFRGLFHAIKGDKNRAFKLSDMMLRQASIGMSYDRRYPLRSNIILTIAALRDVDNALEIIELAELGSTTLVNSLVIPVSKLLKKTMDSLLTKPGMNTLEILRIWQRMDHRLARTLWTMSPDPDINVERRLFSVMEDEKAILHRRESVLSNRKQMVELQAEIDRLHYLRTKRNTDLALILDRLDTLTSAITALEDRDAKPPEVPVDMLDQVQRNLCKNTLLLEYLLAPDDLFIAAIGPDSTEFIHRKRTKPFNDALALCLNAIGDRAAHTDSLSTALQLLGSELLSNLALDPVVEQLIVVPSGDLGYLPFEALLLDSTGTVLLDRKQVRYEISAQEFVDRPIQQDTAPGELIAYAPTFYAAPDRSSTTATTTGLRSAPTPLLFNVSEVEGIESQTPTSVRFSPVATEERFKADAPDAKILHLATHAFSVSADPTRSGIILHRDTTRPAPAWQEQVFGPSTVGEMMEDGILHGFEITPLGLHAELVVLSACETGQGKLKPGDGIQSLARYFYQAGAKAVVSSLWKVDDKATQEIMVSFYEHLVAGKRKSEALALAKQAYRKKHPSAPVALWSAFVLIGNDTPVDLARPAQSLWPWLGASLLLLLAWAVVLNRVGRKAA